jgi:acyl transferase domain-containing protein
VGRIEAEVPVYFGEVIGANLFGKAENGRKEIEVNETQSDLARVALEWTQGGSISWRSLSRGRRRVVVLPTYPFERERCWLKILTHHHPELDEAKAPPPRPTVGRVSVLSLDPSRKTYVAPRNDLEKSLAEIWEQVIGVRHVGVQDRFFEIGGDSMLAGPLINRCEEAFGVRLDVSLLLGKEATIEQLAVATVSALASAQIAANGAVEAMIDDVTHDSRVPTRQGV